MPRRRPPRLRKWRGQWYAVWTDPATGKEIRRSCAAAGAHTKEQRNSWITTLRNEQQEQQIEAWQHGSLTAFHTPLPTALRQWREEVEARAAIRRRRPDTREGLAADTADGYLRVAGMLETFAGPITTGELDASLLESFIREVASTTGDNGRKRGAATLNGYRRDLKSAINWLKRRRPRLLVDPDLLVEGLRERTAPGKQKSAYTPAELREFRNLLSPDLRDLFHLLALTGARLSEVLALQWDQIDFKTGRVTIFAPKTGRWRLLPLTKAPEGEVAPKLLARLRELKRKGHPRPTLATFENESRSEWERCGRIRPQGLRSNFTSYAASLGIPPAVCALWQGHSLTVAEKHYRSQVLDRNKAKSIEAAMGL